MNNQEKEIEKKLKNYVGPEGVSTRELETGLWYVEHKEKLRLALYGFLIIIAAVSWTYTIYGYAYYLARGMKEDQILAAELAQINTAEHESVLAAAAKPLETGPAGVIGSASGKYDLYVQIKNSNRRWWAEFNYYFTNSAGRTESARGFVLPGENKYLLALAKDFAAPPLDVRLVMENMRWRRVSPRRIPDWDDYYLKHLDIETADIRFFPAGAGALSNTLNLNQLSFMAINRTAFNYWQTDFTILLYGPAGLADLNHYTLTNFMSGQKAAVELSWPGNGGAADRVEIIPEINIMEDDIYIPYEGGIGQPK